MALVIDATSNGTIRHLSILKNKSPGYWIYIMSRSVQTWSDFFKISPKIVPPTTPTIVMTVRRFSPSTLRRSFLFDDAGCSWLVAVWFVLIFICYLIYKIIVFNLLNIKLLLMHSVIVVPFLLHVLPSVLHPHSAERVFSCRLFFAPHGSLYFNLLWIMTRKKAN